MSSTDEEVSEAIEEEQDEHVGEDGHTHSQKTRHWLTNDVGFFWVLLTYQTVWASAHLAGPTLGIEVPMPWLADLGAFLSLLAALTWGFGTEFIRAYQEVKGGMP